MSDRLSLLMTHDEFAAIVGVSRQAVDDLARRGVLRRGAPAGEWLLAYTAKLRDEAAGRSVELTQERGRLAKELADAKAMENAQTRKELVPVSTLEHILAQVGRRMGVILERLVPDLQRELKDVDPEVLRVVEREVVRARNEAALLELPLDEIDGSLRDQESDPQGAEGAGGAEAAAVVAMG